MIGAARARHMLSIAYPGGSARNEIRRRVLANNEEGNSRQAAISGVIENIVNEMVEESKITQENDDKKRIKLKLN